MSAPVDVAKIVQQAVGEFMRETAPVSVLEALEESVKLQSHYAGLLNQLDGGKRLRFDSAEEWIARVATIKASRTMEVTLHTIQIK